MWSLLLSYVEKCCWETQLDSTNSMWKLISITQNQQTAANFVYTNVAATALVQEAACSFILTYCK